jgi:hypothetical protein
LALRRHRFGRNGLWQRPPHGWYKCNVDAGFHKKLNKTSVDGVYVISWVALRRLKRIG